MIFGFLEFQKMKKHYFFNGFLQKMKKNTSQHLDGRKKKFSGVVQVVQKMSLRPLFDMTR